MKVDINITSTRIETLNFSTSGLPEGEYIIQTEYSFYLEPFVPGMGLTFVCQSKSVAEVLKKSEFVKFDSRVIFTLNTKSGNMPIAIDLFSLANVAVDFMNQDLRKLLYSIEGMPIFQIVPLTIDKNFCQIEECLL